MIKTLLTLLVLSSPANADVKYDPGTRSVTISGPTTTYQYNQVYKVFTDNAVDTVYMWGPGGEFYAGLSIGRIINDANVRLIVPYGKECVSSCAFAAIAADRVHIDGAMLFHRPFLIHVPTMTTVEDIAAHFGVAYLDMAGYLIDVMGDDGLQFAKRIIKDTSPCRFLSATNVDDPMNAATVDRC